MKEGVVRASIDHTDGVAFTTTHWRVVLEAQGRSAAAQEALVAQYKMASARATLLR